MTQRTNPIPNAVQEEDTELLVHGNPIPSVTQVIVLPDHTLRLKFDTGEQGELHLPTHLRSLPVYAPLITGNFYQQVAIDDYGTLCWPGNIDLDPVVVHCWTMGIPIELASSTANVL